MGVSGVTSSWAVYQRLPGGQPGTGRPIRVENGSGLLCARRSGPRVGGLPRKRPLERSAQPEPGVFSGKMHSSRRSESRVRQLNSRKRRCPRQGAESPLPRPVGSQRRQAVPKVRARGLGGASPAYPRCPWLGWRTTVDGSTHSAGKETLGGVGGELGGVRRSPPALRGSLLRRPWNTPPTPPTPPSGNLASQGPR